MQSCGKHVITILTEALLRAGRLALLLERQGLQHTSTQRGGKEALSFINSLRGRPSCVRSRDYDAQTHPEWGRKHRIKVETEALRVQRLAFFFWHVHIQQRDWPVQFLGFLEEVL
jgi:hypothetical protein